MVIGTNNAFNTFASHLPADVRKAILGKSFDYCCTPIQSSVSDKTPLPGRAQLASHTGSASLTTPSAVTTPSLTPSTNELNIHRGPIYMTRSGTYSILSYHLYLNFRPDPSIPAIVSQLDTLDLQPTISAILHSTNQASSAGRGTHGSLASLEAAIFSEANAHRSLGFWPVSYLKAHGYSRETIDYIHTIFTAGGTLDDSTIKSLEARGMAITEIIWLWALINSRN
jgi:hypothetical protein